MLKALRSIETLRSPSGAKGWLLTIQRRTLIDRHRGREVEDGAISLDGEARIQIEGATHSDPLAWDEPEQILESFTDDDVIAALKGLPEEIRWTLLLIDVEQLDQAEAAEILGVPLGTIKSRAHRGREMVRTRLSPLARNRGWVGGETSKGAHHQ